GFAPGPAIAVPLGEAPHAEAANAVAIRADGREAAVAIEKQIIVHAMDSGEVLRVFDRPGIAPSAGYPPAGRSPLVSAFYDRAASLLDAGDGRVLRQYAVEREAAAVAFADDAKRIAVASQLGPISIFAADSASPTRVLRAPRGSATALAFVGER